MTRIRPSERPSARCCPRPIALSLLAGLCVLSSLKPVRAASPLGPCEGPVSSCIDAETLWATAGRRTFLTLAPTRSLPEGSFAAGAVVSAIDRPMVVSSMDPATGRPVASALVSPSITTTVAVSYGLPSQVELHAALPMAVYQRGAGAGFATPGASELAPVALRDARFGFSHQVRNTPRDAFAYRLTFSIPTGNEKEFAGERGMVASPSAQYEFASGRFVGGLELGLRLRPTTELLRARFGTQGVIAAGVGLNLYAKRPSPWRVHVEARALPMLVHQWTVSEDPLGALKLEPTNRLFIPAEWMVSMRSTPVFSSRWVFELGVGSHLPLTSERPLTTARFRLLGGLTWFWDGQDRRLAPKTNSQERPRVW